MTDFGLSASEQEYLVDPGAIPVNVIIGIDPGLTGAIGIVDQKGRYAGVYDMPVMVRGKGKGAVVNQVNCAALYDLLEEYKGRAIAFIEYVSSMPNQGTSSIFSLGDSFGAIRAVIASLKIPSEFITPQVWKKFYKIQKDKELARAKAIQLFPDAPLARKKDAGRAEALLIARYGYENQVKERP